MIVELHEGVKTEHKVQWKRLKINLTELAKLRFIEKWSVKRLSNHFDRKPDTIQMHLCHLRAGGLNKLNFMPSEQKIIKATYKEVFQGSDEKGKI